LVVLGGGYVGLEFAQAFVRFGSRVTVLQRGPQLLAREDKDVADALLDLLHLDGVDVRLNVEVTQVNGSSGDAVRMSLSPSAGTSVLEGSDILAATGRIPNTRNIGLKNTGVAVDARGYIQVNERLETTAPGIWALGECAGSPQFTHISEDDFRIVYANLHGGSRSTRDRLVPFCLFTDPENRASRTERKRSRRRRPPIPRGEAANAGGPSRSDTIRNTRVYEGTRQARQRRNPRIHGRRPPRGRGPWGRTDCDDGETALYGAARCCLHAPHHG
jgi:Pyridine nucleotide-disulphide oxidoreductase